MHANIASCIMLRLVERVVRRWGGDCFRPPRPVRCSLAGSRLTARRPAVTANGNVSRGPVQLAVVQLGLQQSTLCNSQPGGVLPPLELRRPPLELVRPPLEGELLFGLPDLP